MSLHTVKTESENQKNNTVAWPLVFAHIRGVGLDWSSADFNKRLGFFFEGNRCLWTIWNELAPASLCFSSVIVSFNLILFHLRCKREIGLFRPGRKSFRLSL